jgi:glycine/D-amino acid oxidase-like deaminating enzyme
VKSKYDVAVVGGAGHVGIPLSLVLADRGLRALIYDINQAALRELQAGRLPFIEEGGEVYLRKTIGAAAWRRPPFRVRVPIFYQPNLRVNPQPALDDCLVVQGANRL